VLEADDPPRVKLFKFPPSADNDRGVGLSKRVDNRLAKGGRPKHTNIPDKGRLEAQFTTATTTIIKTS
jgi:hypothetical protein